MASEWVVHILDLRGSDGTDRCVRCGRALNGPFMEFSTPGTLLALRVDGRPTEWRRILERDDLTGDEVSCDRLVLRN
jgi:hypothetical protein